MEETIKEQEKPLLLQLLANRHRNVFNLIIFCFLLFGALFVAWSVPGQLSISETDSALKSATTSLTDPSVKAVVDLPYVLLQKASLHFFGITTTGIKLPSLILGALTGLGILWLLSAWLLRSSIALFTGLIAITSSQFLFAASSGSPLIMPIFWTVILLLLALRLSANHTSLKWSVGVGVVVGLSLYTPLIVYLFFSLLLAVLLHPHLRHLLKNIPKKNVLFLMLCMLLILVPLAIALYKQPSLLASFVGWPGSGQSLGQIKFNLIEIVQSYLLFWKPQLSPLGLSPIFGLGSFCFIIFGALKVIADHHSARSYSLAVLLPVLSLPVLLQPHYAVILFIPFILLLAIGVEALLDEWYKLFPHNPYARVVALVPIIILLCGLVISNVIRYANAYRYYPNLSRNYSQDLPLLRHTLKNNSAANVVVSDSTLPFYSLLRRDFPGIQVYSKLPLNYKNQTLIVMTQSGIPLDTLGTPRHIVSGSYQENEPRFYIY